MRKEIMKWLDSERNFTTGISILFRHGNKYLANNIAGNPKRYSHKLAYELAKLAGYSMAEAIELMNDPRSGLRSVISENAEKIKSVMRKKTNNGQYPSTVRRVIRELSELYNERARMHTSLAILPGENDAETIEKRRILVKDIEEISLKMDLLYEAKDEYFRNKKVPDLRVLFPKYKKGTVRELGGAELMKRKKNLESSLSKDRNMLKFQEKKKLAVENPMPQGPRRTVIEQRISNKEKELQEINERLTQNA